MTLTDLEHDLSIVQNNRLELDEPTWHNIQVYFTRMFEKKGYIIHYAVKHNIIILENRHNKKSGIIKRTMHSARHISDFPSLMKLIDFWIEKERSVFECLT